MAKTYRHVYTFEGNKPLDKVKSVETYERLKGRSRARGKSINVVGSEQNADVQ